MSGTHDPDAIERIAEAIGDAAHFPRLRGELYDMAVAALDAIDSLYEDTPSATQFVLITDRHPVTGERR